ncbi:MAG: hypothetical protein HQM11_01985 [SAR324 cluster bacterium]|nr:hypothetical protein [SAR324 cluster bacterium]
MSHNIRRLVYDQQAIATLIHLKQQGKTSHLERIRARCLALQVDAESQADVQTIHQDPPVYTVRISGMELTGLEPNEGYFVLFTLTDILVTILALEQENPF